MNQTCESLVTELRQVLPNCLRVDRVRIEARLAQMQQAHGQRDTQEAELQRLYQKAKSSALVRHSRYERLPRVTYPSSLPISGRKDEILAAIRNHQVVVLAGETGSGKTTQIPKICLEAGFGLDARIGCTQPRRMAALSVSRRIAEELDVTWGKEVGCKIRFSEETGPETYIKMMTDGILLAETQGDPDLNEYEAIIIDEAHERSLNIDFLLGYLKLLLKRRPDLKLIITSATIDTQAFSKAFDDAPIIEVSGRTYPVEVRYAPIDLESLEQGDYTYVDAAVNAVENVYFESHRGDILVFMPSERDIRETRDLLTGRGFDASEIIPLFGRLSAAEQQRVFAPSNGRKIVIATNIAETSITIPGIRYVVDSGLARVSRYNARTRTKRLPIEPISQSSANQRKGRSGRVESGVCIRLYSEEDFLSRPVYSQPEIQRANLAEVILRMKAFKLGEIETFPFINPPQPQAIQSGYQLLHELGALDEQRNVTEMGRALGRLPVDPTIGRMILQSQREHAVREVLVIASGLSIQDPRERPMEEKDAADLAHKRFNHPESDFLTLLKIWDAFHDQWEKLKTQNQLRKFCKSHFLSYVRMREWCDIHDQLQGALEEIGTVRVNETNAEYGAIHRSILSGLLGHIATRTKERNIYKASGNRQVMVFPGSSLFDRAEKKSGSNAPGPQANKRGPNQPEWIVAGEIVETSRLYARTLAGIQVSWIVELGRHICKFSYAEPGWNPHTERVLIRERIMLNGLEIHNHLVPYGKINSAEATDIFIRCALVEDDLKAPHQFLEQNRQLREKIEAWQTRMRRHASFDLDQAFHNFYAKRIHDVSSGHDLNRFLKEHLAEGPDFLCATEADIVGDKPLDWDEQSFPSRAEVLGEAVALEYAYSPGDEKDGVTVKLPFNILHKVQLEALDWIVPGLRAEQITHLLKSLPKALRVQLMPIPPKVAELAKALDPAEGLQGLSSAIAKLYGVQIPPDAWTRETLPDYLKPRVEITGKDQKAIAAGRDLNVLRQKFEARETSHELRAWEKAVQQWERYDVTSWTFGDLPDQITVPVSTEVPLIAFPGLQLDGSDVNLKLFRNKEQAMLASKEAIPVLAESSVQKELAWVQKDLRALDQLKNLYVTLGPPDELITSAFACIKRHLFAIDEVPWPLTKAFHDQIVNQARSRIPGILPKLISLVTPVLELRQKILLYPKPYSGIRAELDALLPKNFLAMIDMERLQQLPRYLKAMLTRAERAYSNPVKDQDKWRRIQPFIEAWQRLRARPNLTETQKRDLEQFRWMIEELKVSLFAQELGTAIPISEKRLSEVQAKLS